MTPTEKLKTANEEIRVAVRAMRTARELMMEAAMDISKLEDATVYDATQQRRIYRERETIATLTDKMNNAAGRVFRLEKAVADRKPRTDRSHAWNQRGERM